MLVILTMAVLAMPFGRDIVRTVIETDMTPGFNNPGFWLVASVTYLAAQAWFWPRRIIESNYGTDRTHWKHFRHLLDYWPRVLGTIPFAVFAYILLQTDPADRTGTFFGIVALTAAALLGFWLFVGARYRVVEHLGKGKLAAVAHADQPLKSFGFWWPVINVAVSAVIFVLACFAPAHTGHALGPSAIVFLALAGFLPYVTLVGQAGSIFRVPMTLIVALWALGWSFAGDGVHWVGHRAPFGRPALLDQAQLKRETMAAALERWRVAKGDDDQRPVFVIATEGGASRAGLWTARVLNELQSATWKGPHPFSDSVFAISSISGGSVGSVGWVKGLQQAPADANPVVDFAGRDALGPAFATTFYPQALHTFLPIPGLADDAEGLERGWEDNWKTACKACGQGLNQPFLDLYRQPKAAAKGGSASWTPLLLIGGAEEETGIRVMTSPVRFDDIIDADDFFSLSRANISQSTAIHNGARFPWVTSPGRIDAFTSDGGHDGVVHVVDGGYFDGSGVEAAREIVTWQAKGEGQAASESNLSLNHRPKILIIIRYLGVPKRVDTRYKPVTGANGLIGPLVGVFAARDGHEKHLLKPVQPGAAGVPSDSDNTVKAAKVAVVAGTDWNVCYITLFSKPGEDLPMDWVLSQSVDDFMKKGLRQSTAIQTLTALLKNGVKDDLKNKNGISALNCDDQPPTSPDGMTVSIPHSGGVLGTFGEAKAPAVATAPMTVVAKPVPVPARPARHHATHAVIRHHHRR